MSTKACHYVKNAAFSYFGDTQCYMLPSRCYALSFMHVSFRNEVWKFNQLPRDCVRARCSQVLTSYGTEGSLGTEAAVQEKLRPDCGSHPTRSHGQAGPPERWPSWPAAESDFSLAQRQAVTVTLSGSHCKKTACPHQGWELTGGGSKPGVVSQRSSQG